MSNLIPILDTHQHALMTDRWPYSWTTGLAPLEGIRFGVAEYQQAAEGCGIAGTLFMESSPDDPHWREEATVALALAKDPDSLVRGVIANGRPEEDEGFETWVDSIQSPDLKGIRRILHIEPDEVSRQPDFVRNIRRLGEWDLTFDMIFMARQLPLALALARQCENTRFVLDHCGNPDIAAGELDPWRGYIRELAELPHVACKVSGILDNCNPEHADLETVRPYVEHCIECFGWDRVVWGGDWPVCLLTSDLQSWVAICRELIAGEDETNQHKLLHANAERIYRVTL